MNDPVTAAQSPAMEFSADELEFFEQNGFAVARGLCEESLRAELLQLTLDGLQRDLPPIEYEADVHYPGSPESRTATGGRTARRLKQAHSRGIAFTEWAMHPKVIGRLRQLLGPELVMPLVHHNCVMTKQPQFSSDTGWHQDIRYWSFAERELVSVWLALGQEDTQNGCLQVIPGSHRMLFDRERFDDDLFFRTDLPENQELIDQRVMVELNPGDVLFFHCRTFHAASRNYTSQTKYSVVNTYRPEMNRPRPGTRSGTWPELVIPSHDPA